MSTPNDLDVLGQAKGRVTIYPDGSMCVLIPYSEEQVVIERCKDNDEWCYAVGDECVVIVAQAKEE